LYAVGFGAADSLGLKGGGGLIHVSETNDVETRNLEKENDYEHRTGCTPTLTPNPIFNL